MIYQFDKLITLAKNLDPFERTCAITVALKITDQSCKMDEYEKSTFMTLYENMDKSGSDFFDQSIHQLIRNAKLFPTDQKVFEAIKNHKTSAMGYITQPKMKAFKASVRERISPDR